jgi:hypothetical protein
MPELVIRIKKRSDGGAALSCVRADGSTTWQRQEGAHGRFFPLHDLTHYAVETVLGHRRGFFGLIAEGWDISDFGSPWPRGRIPADAEPSEAIVGLLDFERYQGTRSAVPDLDERLGMSGNHPVIDVLSLVTEAQLDAVRACRDELIQRWEELPVGESLELPFDRVAAGPSVRSVAG